MKAFKSDYNHFLDSFFIDSKNESAFEFVDAFLKKPSERPEGMSGWFNFNPLYIYGQAGSGKTHLINAIVHDMLVAHKKVHYTTSKGFMGNYIKALMYNEVAEMRLFYRNIDILVVEDIQFLGRKTKCQEEMTHTLIDRFENKKLTIFSSRIHPNKLKHFDEWLSSRLGMGLAIEIV